jgi:chemotaxis protein MotB
MSRRRTKGHGGEDEERWLLTYSDMITLLLALFIVLFAISSVNKSKFAEFKAGLKAEFVGAGGGVTQGNIGLLSQQAVSQVPHPLADPVRGPAGPIQPATTQQESSPSTTTQTTSAPTTVPGINQPPPAPLNSAQLALLAHIIESSLAARGLIQDVIIDLSPTQLSVELLADKVFFATNSNSLSKVGKEIVDTVGTTVAPYSNDISVRGYADNVPVTGGPWYSNFMLSSARATSVVLRLAHTDGVAEDRLVAEGFGSTHPVASNSTTSGRAQNRRVDIVILAERN